MSVETPKKRGRPRRDPATAPSRAALIRAGLEHLTERGYSSVGLDEVLKSSGVPKGSFYHYFESKSDFCAVLISEYHTYFAGLIDRALADESRAPIDRLRLFMDNAEQGMARHEFRRGCLIGNLGQEMGALPEELRAALIDVLADWQARTAKCIAVAQADGTATKDKSAEDLAAFFWTGWEGAVLRAKLERSPAPLRLFGDLFMHMLTP